MSKDYKMRVHHKKPRTNTSMSKDQVTLVLGVEIADHEFDVERPVRVCPLRISETNVNLSKDHRRPVSGLDEATTATLSKDYDSHVASEKGKGHDVYVRKDHCSRALPFSPYFLNLCPHFGHSTSFDALSFGTSSSVK